MRKLNLVGLGSVVLAAMGLFALSAGGAGCSSDEDGAVATEAGTEASAADTGVVVVVDSGVTGPCMTCVEMTRAAERIPNSPGPCDNNDVNGTGKSSKQLFDDAFKCACQDNCGAECADSCGSGAELGGACLACAASACTAQYNACNADVRGDGADSGSEVMDSGMDSTTSNDASISDAAVGQ